MPRQLPTLATPPGTELAALPPALANSVGFLANQLGARIRREIDHALEDSGLTPRHFLLLLVLRDEASLSQQALGARAGFDRTTTMQAAQLLADRGLITRSDDPHDRRIYRLSLTATGRTQVGELEAQVQRAEAAVLASLSVDERAQLLALLRRWAGVMPSCAGPVEGSAHR